jgi:molybdopterin-containing oxidoreductase family membrane subunit
MKTVYKKIDGNTTQYYGLLVLLLLGVLTGAYAFLLTYTQGHHLTGMSNQVPWGLPIIMVIFLIGASAGGLDLGRPERSMYLFKYLNLTSVFAANAFLYNSYIFICFAYLWAMFEERTKLIKALGVLAVFWAVAVHSGTGTIFGFIFSRELYHSPLTPPSFLIAALASGTGFMILLLLATFKFTRRELDGRLMVGLGKLMAMFLLLMLYVITLENLTRAYSPELRHAMQLLMFTSPFSLVFWGGLVAMGMIIPLAILLYPRTGNSVPWVTLASVMVVLGVLAERYIIVVPGLVLPQSLFPGKEVSSAALDGMITMYSIRPVEIGIIVGVLSFVGLAYAIGLKVFELLPVEAKLEEPVAVAEAVPEVKEEAVEAKECECELCGAKFQSMDECCEHAEAHGLQRSLVFYPVLSGRGIGKTR